MFLTISFFLLLSAFSTRGHERTGGFVFDGDVQGFNVSVEANIILDGPILSHESLCLDGDDQIHWWGCGKKEESPYIIEFAETCAEDQRRLKGSRVPTCGSTAKKRSIRRDKSVLRREKGFGTEETYGCPDRFYCNVRGRCSSNACRCTPGEPNSNDRPADSAKDVLLDCGSKAGDNSGEHSTAITKSTRTLSPLPQNITDGVFWFHVPKAGSSFLTTLFHWACPRVPVDVALAKQATSGFLHRHWQQWAWCDVLFTSTVPGHSPYIRVRDKGRAAALFRRPQQRIMSAYNAGLHHYGMRDFRAMQAAVRRKAAIDPEGALKMYAEWPGIEGCQTKMVLGKTCSSLAPITLGDLEEAKRIVEREFLFVGLTGEFDRSVCLFHAMLGGTVYPNEFLDSRKTADLDMTESDRMAGFLVVNSKRKRFVRSRRVVVDANDNTEMKTRTATDIFRKLENDTYDESVLRRIGYHDRYDEALYLHVKAVFDRRVAMYDLGDCMDLARWTRAATASG